MLLSYICAIVLYLCYRPISVLSTVLKVLKGAVHTELYNFLTREQLLNPYQYGFRKGHSMELAVLSFTDSVRRNIWIKACLRVPFSYIYVRHELSVAYGIEGRELAWFELSFY